MLNIFLSILMLILISSCKTTEEIKREQLVNNLTIQVSQSQKISKDTLSKMEELESRMNQLTGSVEETQHESKQTYEQRLMKLEIRLSKLESAHDRLTEIESKVNSQSDFIKKVSKTLNVMAKGSSRSSKRAVKKQSPYQNAMNLYRRGKYSESKVILEELFRKSNLRLNQKARVTHNLGMISFMEKDYEQAKIYFSKLITDYSKTGYVPNGLLYLAKSFKATEDNKAAIEAVNLILSKHPKSKSVNEAKKLLKTLK